MGGKRPDQYNLDPGEAGASDYKNLPQTGRGTKSHDDTERSDRQRLEQSRKDAKGQPFPPDVPAPSVHTRHRREAEERMDEELEQPGAATSDPRRENPLV